MTVLDETEWVRNEPEWIGPHDEVSEYFHHLCAAARSASSIAPSQLSKMAKWAMDLQAETIVWMYEEDDQSLRDFFLPSIDDAKKYLIETNGSSDWPTDGMQTRDFAMWVMDNQPEDWREQAYERNLRRELARISK